MGDDDEDAALAHQQELEEQELFRTELCTWLAKFKPLVVQLENLNGSTATRDCGF